MSKNLLHISRQLKVILQKNATLEQSLKDINLEVKCSTDCNIIILDKTGKIITNDYDDQTMQIIKDSPSKAEEKIITQFNDQLQNIIDTRENITFSNFYIKNIISDELANLNTTIIPLIGSSGRIGTVVLYKKGQFSDEQIVIAEFSSIIIGLLIMHFLDEEEAIETRRANIMRSAISTLSYSELEAIIHIVDELDGTEGLLIASKVADKVGITRSVIVNALRKLESAGILESRSLGMKGTYIKISNDLLLTEISKLKK